MTQLCCQGNCNKYNKSIQQGIGISADFGTAITYFHSTLSPMIHRKALRLVRLVRLVWLLVLLLVLLILIGIKVLVGAQKSCYRDEIPSMPICYGSYLYGALHLAYRIPWHNYLTCRSVLQYPWSCCPCKPRCWHKHPEHTGTPRWSHVESAIFKCIWSSTCIIMPKMAGCQLYHIFSNSLALLLIHWIQKQVKTIKLTHCLISSVMRSKISIASLSLRRKTACLCFIHLLLKTIPKKTPECSHTWYNTQYSRIHDKQKCTSMHYDAFIWWRHRS